MINNNNNDEIKQLREQIEQLQGRVRDLEEDQKVQHDQPVQDPQTIPVPINNRPPVPPAGNQQAEQPTFFRNALHFMYNVGNMHAILRNFGWAVHDGAYVIGGVGSVAVAAAKVAPVTAAKATATAKAAAAAAAAGASAAAPYVAGAAGVALGAMAIEKLTRYKDEEGKTRHHCAIL